MASCILRLKHARWRMRALQWDVKSQWQQHQGNLSNLIQESEETAKDLQWWLSGRPLALPHPELTVVTDASLLGWGGHQGEVEIRVLWSPAETLLHINLLALKAFLPPINGRLVQVFTDHTTAIWYCNKQGDVGSWTLCQEALHF